MPILNSYYLEALGVAVHFEGSGARPYRSFYKLFDGFSSSARFDTKLSLPRLWRWYTSMKILMQIADVVRRTWMISKRPPEKLGGMGGTSWIALVVPCDFSSLSCRWGLYICSRYTTVYFSVNLKAACRSIILAS